MFLSYGSVIIIESPCYRYVNSMLILYYIREWVKCNEKIKKRMPRGLRQKFDENSKKMVIIYNFDVCMVKNVMKGDRYSHSFKNLLNL